jgi:hypothetical protein
MLVLAMLISERYKAKRFAEGRAEGRREEVVRVEQSAHGGGSQGRKI